MTTEPYRIRLDGFEGPMDLLMHLIEKNRIDLYDIPIARLTEQYLEYLDAMRRFDIEIASEFLVMAATLLYIKSRMMLPKPPKESEAAEEDPRRELIERILEYQRYKKVSRTLADMAENLSPAALWQAFQLLSARRRELTIPRAIVAHEEFRVEEQMVAIMERLAAENGPLPFETLFAVSSRGEVVADFLALLELIRRKYIAVRQDSLFSAILIYRREAPTTAGNGDGADVFD